MLLIRHHYLQLSLPWKTTLRYQGITARIFLKEKIPFAKGASSYFWRVFWWKSEVFERKRRKVQPKIHFNKNTPELLSTNVFFATQQHPARRSIG